MYGAQQVEVAIRTGDILAGALPTRAYRLVREWGEQYRTELLANWALARAGRPLSPIPPLS